MDDVYVDSDGFITSYFNVKNLISSGGSAGLIPSMNAVYAAMNGLELLSSDSVSNEITAFSNCFSDTGFFSILSKNVETMKNLLCEADQTFALLFNLAENDLDIDDYNDFMSGNLENLSEEESAKMVSFMIDFQLDPFTKDPMASKQKEYEEANARVYASEKIDGYYGSTDDYKLIKEYEDYTKRYISAYEAVNDQLELIFGGECKIDSYRKAPNGTYTSAIQEEATGWETGFEETRYSVLAGADIAIRNAFDTNKEKISNLYKSIGISEAQREMADITNVAIVAPVEGLLSFVENVVDAALFAGVVLATPKLFVSDLYLNLVTGENNFSITNTVWSKAMEAVSYDVVGTISSDFQKVSGLDIAHDWAERGSQAYDFTKSLGYFAGVALTGSALGAVGLISSSLSTATVMGVSSLGKNAQSDFGKVIGNQKEKFISAGGKNEDFEYTTTGDWLNVSTAVAHSTGKAAIDFGIYYFAGYFSKALSNAAISKTGTGFFNVDGLLNLYPEQFPKAAKILIKASKPYANAFFDLGFAGTDYYDYAAKVDFDQAFSDAVAIIAAEILADNIKLPARKVSTESSTTTQVNTTAESTAVTTEVLESDLSSVGQAVDASSASSVVTTEVLESDLSSVGQAVAASSASSVEPAFIEKFVKSLETFDNTMFSRVVKNSTTEVYNTTRDYIIEKGKGEAA